MERCCGLLFVGVPGVSLENGPALFSDVQDRPLDEDFRQALASVRSPDEKAGKRPDTLDVQIGLEAPRIRQAWE